jgi:hypothetical protein
VYTFETFTEPMVDDRVRLDALDPKDWWMECSACETAWQVPYSEQSVG